jgi:hypothetical protein
MQYGSRRDAVYEFRVVECAKASARRVLIVSLTMTVSTSLKRLFWNGDAGTAPATAPAPVSAPTTAAPAASGIGDFAPVYARTGAAGDARVDQVLAAFEAMKSAMPAPQLAIAIGATARAIGAEPAAVVDTLGKRLLALDAALADERRATTERQAARSAELATAATTVEADIKAMEDKIAALRQRLATATGDIERQHAAEHARIAELDRRARDEAARLTALRDFLRTK